MSFDDGHTWRSLTVRPWAEGLKTSITDRRRLQPRPETIARDVNSFIRGWAGYFRYGHSTQSLSKVRRLYASPQRGDFRRHAPSRAGTEHLPGTPRSRRWP
ncbi:group II intron maturase-specific domain-containing protein [Nonomuraea sp. CA-143628]|uniref:group II intron maturase-specific domain-containing protein n=1 Tax=Nonomuraea sp. CA-143628 TaxID=3239997 RepID=UPI003D89C097